MSSPLEVLAPQVGTADQVTILHGVSWRTYESLLADIGDARSPRLAFNGGVLEIMSPSRKHEGLGALLAQLVQRWADRFDLDIESSGALTLRRDDLEKGVEPDASFFIGSAARMSGRLAYDAAIDPPPDLIVEVDVTSPAVDKFGIYHALGVPEIWHFADETGFRILLLEDEGFTDSENSRSFLALTAEAIRRVLAEYVESGESKALKLFKTIISEV